MSGTGNGKKKPKLGNGETLSYQQKKKENSMLNFPHPLIFVLFTGISHLPFRGLDSARYNLNLHSTLIGNEQLARVLNFLFPNVSTLLVIGQWTRDFSQARFLDTQPMDSCPVVILTGTLISSVETPERLVGTTVLSSVMSTNTVVHGRTLGFRIIRIGFQSLVMSPVALTLPRTAVRTIRE